MKMWTILLVFACIIFAYGYLVRRLRRSSHIKQSNRLPGAGKNPLDADEAERYARHIVLREIGGPGQVKLKKASVLVIGAGGIGSPVLLYLAAAGVGRIGIVDDDRVEVSNLQRQVIHNEKSLGKSKTLSAGQAVKQLNSHIHVGEYEHRIDDDNAAGLIGMYDLVIDGSDNFETRRLVNRACVELGKPLVFAAIGQWEGQVGLVLPGKGPCYACLFPTDPAPGQVPNCAEAGVLGALPGVMGSMAAVEAIKSLTGAGDDLSGKILIYDALHGMTRLITHDINPGCKVCGGIALPAPPQ